MSTPLEDYALLADLHTGPLVSRDGSVDWLCFPRFDSPAVFCKLLGTEDNGHWRLSAVDGHVVSRRYVGNSFVLETEWSTPTGRVVVTDFLPLSDEQSDLVRRVHCTEGTVEVEHDLIMRFDYGLVTPWVRRVHLEDGTQGDPSNDRSTAPTLMHAAGLDAAPRSDGPGAAVAGSKEPARHPATQHGSAGPHEHTGRARKHGTVYESFRDRVRSAAHRARTPRAVEEGLLAVAGPDALLLTGPMLEPYRERLSDGERSNDHHDEPGPGSDPVNARKVRRGHHGRFTLQAGEQLDWVLTWGRSYELLPLPADPQSAQQATEEFWESWADEVTCPGEFGEHVNRSLLVLRALTHSGTGGIVAAPTTSLPEDFGGERNWDYRHTWLRDAALTIQALVTHGHQQGALLWRDWLLRAVAGDPAQLQIMYGIDGRRDLTEQELTHLPGYEGSRPVRIGNAAVTQYQADVAGAVMIALAALRDAGVSESEYSWALQTNLLRFCELHMDVKDNGIWEMRGKPEFFTHGRVMMWAAYNEGLRAVRDHVLPGDVERWTRLRDRLEREIWEHGYSEELNSFTQTYDNTEVDASLLQLPQTGFIAADHPAMQGTVTRIEDQLQGDHGQVWRYRTTESGTSMDGLTGQEYPFVICTFWLVEQYASSGRLAEAQELMRTTVGFASDLGLLAEEYAVSEGRMAGNFPQAFSHLGLIRAADAIQEAQGRTA